MLRVVDQRLKELDWAKYCRLMGGAVRWTKSSIEKRLLEGSNQYRDHENASDDMVEAGQELARVV